jgi:predicted DNA-binding protein with PD1-like motif
MMNKCINPSNPTIYAVVFDRGEELLEGLTRFAVENVVSSSYITAVGAFSGVTLGYFDRDRKDYKRIQVDEQVEVLSLLGDITIENGKPKVHARTIVGKSDGSTHGGHVIKAKVWPTLEVIVTESPEYLTRKHDPETGLTLISIEA